MSSARHRLRIRNAIAKLTPSLRPTTGIELEEAKAPAADDARGHARDGVAKKLGEGFCGQRFRGVRRNNAYPISSWRSLRLTCAIDSCRRVNPFS